VYAHSQGIVTSSPDGISCPSTCAAGYASGTVVTLTAVPASGKRFWGWRGPCRGTDTCTVTLGRDVFVSAYFSLW
jgi:hypothetical protein